GGREGKDPEAVHRMRVAYRRLRARLPVFSRCYPARIYRWISGGISRITKDLGNARDLDVQINYLEEILANRTDMDEPEREGVHTLLPMIRTKRAARQPNVIAYCNRLEMIAVLDPIGTHIRAWKKKSALSKGTLPG